MCFRRSSTSDVVDNLVMKLWCFSYLSIKLLTGNWWNCCDNWTAAFVRSGEKVSWNNEKIMIISDPKSVIISQESNLINGSKSLLFIGISIKGPSVDGTDISLLFLSVRTWQILPSEFKMKRATFLLVLVVVQLLVSCWIFRWIEFSSNRLNIRQAIGYTTADAGGPPGMPGGGPPGGPPGGMPGGMPKPPGGSEGGEGNYLKSESLFKSIFPHNVERVWWVCVFSCVCFDCLNQKSSNKIFCSLSTKIRREH